MLYPREGNKRWTNERLLEICERLDRGEKLANIARECEVGRHRLDDVVRRFRPRWARILAQRELELDRQRRPNYYAELDRQQAELARQYAEKERQRALADWERGEPIRAEARRRREAGIPMWDKSSIR